MVGALYNAKMTEESRSTRAPKSNLRRCCNNLPNRIEDKRLPVGRASIVLLGQPIGPTLTKVWLPEKKKTDRKLGHVRTLRVLSPAIMRKNRTTTFSKGTELRYISV